MKTQTFKILTHCGQFIDENLLEKGLYSTSVPQLKSENVTIEGMIQSAKMMRDAQNVLFLSDSYFENLNKCILIDYALVLTT